MAQQETLVIKITADNKDAIAGMRQTIASMDGVAIAAGKTAGAVSSMNTTYMNLGRVIQDLPYGFNGIANNLTQLIPSVGLAGIAFSGLVAALTFAQTGMGAWTRGLTGAKKATDEYNDSVTKEREGAEKTIIGLRALIAVAQDVSLSTDKRKIAVDKLRADYPAYFKELSDEKIMTGDLATVTDTLTAAIYKRAMATALSTDIAKKANEVNEKRLRIEKIDAELAKERLNPTQGVTVSGGTLGGVSSSAFQSKSEVETKLLKEKDQLLTDISKITIQVATGQNQLNNLTGDSIGLDQKATKAIKDKLTEAEKWAKFLEHFKGKMKAEENQLWDLTPVKDDKQGVPKVDFAGVPQTAAEIGRQQTQSGIDYQKKLRERREQDAAYDNAEIEKTLALQKEQALTMTNLLSPAFENLFQTMADGGNIGESLLNSFKQIAVQLTSMVIKALIFKAILKALKLSNPLTAGVDAASDIAGGISGGLSIIGLLRGQDMQLMLDRTGTGNSYRRGG